MAALIGLLSCTVAGWPSVSRAGSLSYLVTVDSTGISGLSGFLETQLATAAPPATPSVTATIGSVSTDGIVGAVTFTAGDVSGSFSSTPLTLANDTASSSITGLSDVQQAFTYGTTLSFVLTLSGSEVMSGNSATPFTGTVFTFILEDANQNGLNSGPLFPGEAFDIYVNPGGGSLMVAPNDPYLAGGPVPGFAPAAEGDPSVTIAPFSVPEPSSFVLLGLGTLILFSRYRRARSA
jgi:PEP-CTERM motif